MGQNNIVVFFEKMTCLKAEGKAFEENERLIM